MGLSQSLAFWFQTPVFWVVVGVLLLGLEMINRRLVYFLPGSIAAMTLAVLIALAVLGIPLFGLALWHTTRSVLAPVLGAMGSAGPGGALGGIVAVVGMVRFFDERVAKA